LLDLNQSTLTEITRICRLRSQNCQNATNLEV